MVLVGGSVDADDDGGGGGGGEAAVWVRLRQLLRCAEPYCHPSNAGPWCGLIGYLLQAMAQCARQSRFTRDAPIPVHSRVLRAPLTLDLRLARALQVRVVAGPLRAPRPRRPPRAAAGGGGRLGARAHAHAALLPRPLLEGGPARPHVADGGARFSPRPRDLAESSPPSSAPRSRAHHALTRAPAPAHAFAGALPRRARAGDRAAAAAGAPLRRAAGRHRHPPDADGAADPRAARPGAARPLHRAQARPRRHRRPRVAPRRRRPRDRGRSAGDARGAAARAARHRRQRPRQDGLDAAPLPAGMRTHASSPSHTPLPSYRTPSPSHRTPLPFFPQLFLLVPIASTRWHDAPRRLPPSAAAASASSAASVVGATREELEALGMLAREKTAEALRSAGDEAGLAALEEQESEAAALSGGLQRHHHTRLRSQCSRCAQCTTQAAASCVCALQVGCPSLRASCSRA